MKAVATFADLGIPQRLRDHDGVKEADIPELSVFGGFQRDVPTGGNPRDTSVAEIERFLPQGLLTRGGLMKITPRLRADASRRPATGSQGLEEGFPRSLLGRASRRRLLVLDLRKMSQ